MCLFPLYDDKLLNRYSGEGQAYLIYLKHLKINMCIRWPIGTISGLRVELQLVTLWSSIWTNRAERAAV